MWPGTKSASRKKSPPNDRSHAPLGNAARDAPRPYGGDAERHGLHSHAERGNDQSARRQTLANQGCCSRGNPAGR
ncbi:hypothetical protein FQ192_13260 [Pseudomonas sp. ANT_J12]|nr:hypothetical protein FQ192_13260 [Pseudomonas sp. ANT_J12]